MQITLKGEFRSTIGGHKPLPWGGIHYILSAYERRLWDISSKNQCVEYALDENSTVFQNQCFKVGTDQTSQRRVWYDTCSIFKWNTADFNWEFSFYTGCLAKAKHLCSIVWPTIHP